MGEIAEMMLDGTLDEQTGEYIGKAVGYPRTMQKKFYKKFYNNVIKNETAEQKQIRAIRKEIALDIKSGTRVQEARKKANIKYGKGWRKN